ncbi:ketosteroid isomerase-like protein [Stella humosa]|uniref:Ketosteroid isomerase-like protein n=1 Tax=Stella humosa TaxID=94 RepID=A0A3N1M8V0_9PROT|nr:nuclear transport factor 2 family protein [Stella humosa]ROQ00098.1 ketosteroid isomerase-like protein [Stella humosa]BBK30667.1 polyketide cyclase [Stella humosa]
MTTDHGARLGEMARAFTAAVMAGDGPALAALFTPDGTYVDGFYGPFTGRAAIAGMLHEHFHGAGRDFRWDMVDPVSDGRIGYVRYLFSYTSTMPEAAGRRVVFAGMGCFELVDGAIARYSEVFERGSALAQLDFAPERIKKALLRWAAADAGRPDAAPHRAVG